MNILDTNDNVPRFDRTEYKANVIENAPAGTVVDTITVCSTFLQFVYLMIISEIIIKIICPLSFLIILI